VKENGLRGGKIKNGATKGGRNDENGRGEELN